MEELRPGARLEGPFWPEPVEILRVEPHGELWRVFAVGLSSGRYHGERWLGPEDLRQIRILPPASPGLRGDPQAVFLGLEAHRIRLAHQFDPLHALHISMIDPLPHQIDAVYFHMLPKARLRFLLADDPGAGKTIMAGLLLKELKHRGAVERVLIVVPGHLRDQWIRELKEKFGETFLVVDRHTLNSTYGRNPWREGLQFITSMDFAKQEEILATLSDVEWDLVIVDEAHKLSAWRFGDRTKKTQRYRLGEVLARNSRLLLFLTATPHRGDPENFRLLLSLLDPDLFAKAEHLEEAVRRGENPLVLRRLKEDLRTIDGVPLFPPRYVHTVLFRLSPEEMAFYEALTRYVRDEFNRALDAERRNVQFALMLLQRRLASSLYAARRSLERRKERLQKLLERGELLRERGEVDEEELEDLPEAERWKREEELLEKLTAARTLEELREEIRRLEELIVLGRDLERAGVETKLRELKKLLSELGRTHPDEKLVVFTESRDSLEYLAKNVRQWGYEVTVLHGGMNLEERIRAEAEFRDRAQILISTEAGGEGINLQFASLMVNYDIPWNPNRLEQRMGRIHRYGQRHEVHIYNLVAENTVEGEVLRRLFQKLQRIREALGSDRVFDVIQEVLRGRSLADLILEALSGRRSLAEIVAEIEAMPDPEAIERIRQATAEALATRHIDLSRILGEERRAKENRLVPEYVEEFFRRATEFLGIRLSRNEEGLWRVGLVPAFLRQRSADFRARFGEVRDTYRRLTFYKDEAWKKGAEYTGPGHPLFEAVLEEILVRTTADREEGAVFLDPNRKLLGTIFFVEASIEDGNGETAGKRLFAALFPPDGEPSPIHPAILYDLLPGRGTVPFDPPDPERVRAFVARELVPKFLSELTGERKRQAEIRRRYGLRSLDSRIAEAVETILDLESRRARGEEIPQVAIDQAHRRREELEERRKTFAERIKREEILLPGEIKILGVVAVLPVPESPEEPTPDPALEKIGMEEAMAYERRNGREPVDVSRENLGYDIRSEGPGEVRYIEVKTRAKPGPVLLTQNEWLMAHRLGAEYWLYVVTVEEGPRLWLIRNPAELPAEKKTVVQYALDWRNWAEPAEG